MNDVMIWLSVGSSLVGIIGGPLSLYFSYKAAKSSAQAVSGANELARRMSKEALYNMDDNGDVASVRVQIHSPK